MDLDIGTWSLGFWRFGFGRLGFGCLGFGRLGIECLACWTIQTFLFACVSHVQENQALGLDIGTWSFGFWHLGFGRLCFGCLSFGRFSIECLALAFELRCVSFSLLVSAFRPVFELLAIGLLALGFLAFTQAT